MVGAVVIVLVLVVGLPAVWWAIWAVAGAVLGRALRANAEATHAGSELIETNY